jgi:23S rRNA (cytidine1920-2'-O)/16S rRNA (cytidine1409-2'-O)-methyltransferase
MAKQPKERIDKLLIDRGFAESRNKAQAMIMAGNVVVGDRRVEKPSETFEIDQPIRIKGDNDASRYVGRGGLKLEAALAAFSIDPTGWTCIDIGSSTGGFTDCLLQHGASRVVAIDAGTNQLVWSLRTDARVDVRENTNARHLTPEEFDTRFDLAVMDVSFISATKVIPPILDLLTAESRLVVLVKPQFEVGKGEVGKGGIVRDDEKRERVLAEVNKFAEGLGLVCRGSIESPISGAQGNREFLTYYVKREQL